SEICGDALCNGSESPTNCPSDCGSVAGGGGYCGDGTCRPTRGETATTCPTDCSSQQQQQSAPSVATLVSGVVQSSVHYCDATDCVYADNTSSSTNGRICIISTSGGSPNCIATGLEKPRVPIFSGANVCWSNNPADITTSGIFCKARTGQGSITTVSTTSTGPQNNFYADENNFYWGDGIGGPSGRVRGVPLGGGSKVNLVSSLAYPRAFMLKGSTLFFAISPGNIGGNDSRGLKSISTVGGSLASIASDAAAGGGVKNIATTSVTFSTVRGIDADNTNLYWAEGTALQNNGAVKYAPLSGGGDATTLVSGITSIGGVQIHNGYAYFSGTLNNTTGIYRVLTTGGTPSLYHAESSGIVFSSQIVGDTIYFEVSQDLGATVDLKKLPIQ
ncbi:MAG: hypothetical protein HYT77_09800, partial [Deltaproteobacteria bacterium]|nr:hypothetical protein [Deltaproteobacteria bacterium]